MCLVEERLKLAPSRPPKPSVTNGGKTGNLFAHGVCWEQMTRKIKKTLTKWKLPLKDVILPCVRVFFFSLSLLFSVLLSPYFLETQKEVVDLALMKSLLTASSPIKLVLMLLCSLSRTRCGSVNI